MRIAFTAPLFLALFLAACGGSDAHDAPAPTATTIPSAEIPIVDITKTEDGFEAPDSIPAGITRIRVHNAGAGGHAVHLNRLRGEATLEQFNDALRLTDFAASAAELDRLTDGGGGGTGTISPGGTSEVVLDLEPGRYVIVRFPFPITRLLEVTAAPDAQPAPPESDFTVSMREFAYEGFPDTLPAGITTVAVVNEGEQYHLMDVRRVNEEGITAEQVSQHLGGTPLPLAPSYTAAGGMGEMTPGAFGWATLDLEPGVYTLICTVFDQHDGEIGKLHFQLGMHHSFTVE